MRLAGGLAIALWLSLTAAGMASRQQDAASSASAAAQVPAETAPPAENVPARKSPAPPAPDEKSRTESAPAEKIRAETPPAAEKKTSASGTTKRRKRAASAPDGAPRKIVVREGGASEPAAQIAPDMTPAQAARQRQNAEQLLGSTGDQLKQLGRCTLNAQQQETVGQIRNYMQGARSALQEGDVRRANTLAQKAHLLAADLVKH